LDYKLIERSKNRLEKSTEILHKLWIAQKKLPIRLGSKIKFRLKFKLQDDR
jgi:hypothetical protein